MNKSYFKVIVDGFIVGLSTSGTAGEKAMTEDEFDSMMDRIHSAPHAPDGYEYRLRADSLEWELVELPPVPEPEPSDDEALTRYANELTGGNAETLQEATETLIKIVKEDK